MRWRIILLGRLRAEGDGQLLERFRSQKTGALLATLAYFLHRSHLRDALIEWLWPGDDPQAGRNRLSVALSSLRQQLEPPGVPAGSVLIADRTSIRLNPEAITTDVTAFQAALQSAESAGSPREQAERLGEAVALYRGELLAGYYEDWILQEREWLAHAAFRALAQRIELFERAGDQSGALEMAREAVRLDPLREESHRELIRLLATSGQPQAALRQYGELERLLHEQLDATPDAATCALVASLRSQPVAGSRQPVEEEPVSPTASVGTADVPTGYRLPATGSLPSGTVTFLLTDIEGSTALWERFRSFREALHRHHSLLRRLFRQHAGYEVKELGDGFLTAFGSAGEALACAIACQQALAAESWPEVAGSLRVRMALHTGDAQPEEGDYHSLALHQAQRIMDAGHGGQLLCSEATAALLRSGLEPDVRLLDLGLYRLRNMATPARLFHVEYPGMSPQEFPPLRAEPDALRSLPAPLTRFFGREAEIVRLRELLLAPATRLVTLTGPGGSGKTRLALEVARRQAATGGLGCPASTVCFVPLGDLTPTGSRREQGHTHSALPADGAAGVRHRIAEAIRERLGLPPSPSAAPLEQVVEALSSRTAADSSGGAPLLVLDNFEHLVLEGAPLVRTLLERVPTLTLLITSRRRLALPGEREFLVGPLPVPDGRCQMSDGRERREQSTDLRDTGRPPFPLTSDICHLISAFPSVQLFVDRAQAVRPDFELTPANAAAVASLCRRLEGIPLALELAAARAQVLTPAQMVARLEQRFELLVSGERDVAARRRSLRATLDWSYELLAPELQRFFACLCVFRGGWMLEAAEEVCDEGLAIDYLAQLRDCSLVVTEEAAAEIRFRMLETVHEYARARSRPEEQAALARRHATYHLALAERAELGLQGPDQGLWLDRLEMEHENLRAALEHWIRNGETEAGLRLATALYRFWSVRGYWAEGREQYARLLEQAGADVPLKTRARALNVAGLLAYRQGDYAAARSAIEESLAIQRELGEPRGIAESLNSLALVAWNQGEYGSARALHEEGLAIRRALGEPRGIATALTNLGLVAWAQGDYGSARTLYEEALEVWRDLGDPRALAACLANLGNVLQDQEEPRAACRCHEESLALRRELDDRSGMADSLATLGLLAHSRGDGETARARLQEALLLSRELGDQAMIACSLTNLGCVVLEQGDPDLARSLLIESLGIGRELGDMRGVAASLEGLAGVASRQGEYVQTARLLGGAEAVRETIGAPLLAADREDTERRTDAARAGLGDAKFAAEWTAGRAMTPEEAIRCALDEGWRLPAIRPGR
jgi:predicted ATPase/DNA-binding SARP family transcriptional activator/Tfp pilus assembly protein PilF